MHWAANGLGNGATPASSFTRSLQPGQGWRPRPAGCRGSRDAAPSHPITAPRFTLCGDLKSTRANALASEREPAGLDSQSPRTRSNDRASGRARSDLISPASSASARTSTRTEATHTSQCDICCRICSDSCYYYLYYSKYLLTPLMYYKHVPTSYINT